MTPILYVKVNVDPVLGKSTLNIYKLELTGSRIAEIANGTFQGTFLPPSLPPSPPPFLSLILLILTLPPPLPPPLPPSSIHSQGPQRGELSKHRRARQQDPPVYCLCTCRRAGTPSLPPFLPPSLLSAKSNSYVPSIYPLMLFPVTCSSHGTPP